jgi:hypothetical protein
MYNDPWEQQNREQKENKAQATALLAHLSRSKDNAHFKTALRLVDTLARLEATNSWLVEQSQKPGMAPETESFPYEGHKQFIELPRGTRKVSIEL